MRDYKETLQWYRDNQTAAQIGFDPDGMCLKVCRTARGIGPKFLTAKQAQDATPKENRFYKVSELRKGMVLFFDDPNDSNTAGHIVTMIGRVPGFDPNSLHDVLVETNSVKSNELVVVRADYFQQHWGDAFKFGANHLNGVTFDVYEWGGDSKPQVTPLKRAESRKALEKFKKDRLPWDVDLLSKAAQGIPALRPVVAEIKDAVSDIEDLKSKEPRVVEFVKAYKKDHVLRMGLLNELVKEDARFVRVKANRDRLHRAIKTALR